MPTLTTRAVRGCSLALVAVLSIVLAATPQIGALAQDAPQGAVARAVPSATPTETPTETPTPTPTPDPTPTPEPTPTAPPLTRDPGVIRIAHANIRSGMSDAKFRADVATVMATQPDLVTYNEVVCRWDSVLAPVGYDFWRPMVPAGKVCPGGSEETWRYKRYNVVAWRTDRWQVVDKGTWRVTKAWGKTKKQSTHLGVRFANWATLRSVADGRMLSVVSTHWAPPDSHYDYDALLKQSARRIGKLAENLAASGPVIIGGDLNVGYRAAKYPRKQLEKFSLASTYDATGAPLTTFENPSNGNRFTIDYFLTHRPQNWTVLGQYATDLNSDHKALIADLTVAGTAVTRTLVPGTLMNYPKKGGSQAKLVVNTLARTIAQAPKGARIRVESRKIGQKKLVNALLAADQRGVKVKVITHRSRLGKQERRLFKQLGSKVKKKKSAVVCSKKCRRIAKNKKIPRTRLIIDTAGTESSIVVGFNRPLTPVMVKKKTRAKITVGTKPYNKNVRWFDRMERGR